MNFKSREKLLASVAALSLLGLPSANFRSPDHNESGCATDQEDYW